MAANGTPGTHDVAGGDKAATGTFTFRWDFQAGSTAVDENDSVTVSCPFGSAEADDTFYLSGTLSGFFKIDAAHTPNISA